jgi:hypothetical protein
MRFEYRFGPDPSGIFDGRSEARAIERKSNEVIAAVDQRGTRIARVRISFRQNLQLRIR